MLPKIKKVAFRSVHIDDSVYTDSDLFLFSYGIETADATHKVTMEDFKKMLLHEPDIAVFGVGFRNKVAVSQSVRAAAKKHGVELHVLPTSEAAKKFTESARRGKKVVAKLHITC